MSLALSSRRAALMPGQWVRNELWRRAKAVPSLDLRFADSKSLVDATTGQSLVTFTRASSGTYVGSEGLIKTATTNEPRFDHNPTTGESLGLLVEEQRTNLVLRSEELDNASWTRSANISITANSTVAPDGTQTADTVSMSSGAHALQQIVSVVAGTTYAFSFYVRRGTATDLRFSVYNVSAGADIIAPTSYYSTTSSSSWVRVSVSFTAPAGCTSASVYPVRDSGTTGTLFLWGAQLEAGAFSTSYIPTTTATVTRSADVASITGTNFSSWYRQDEGTVFADAAIANTGSNRFIAGASDATVNEEIALYWNTTFNSLVNDGGVGQANSFGGTVTAGTRALHSFAYKLNDFQGYGNAVALAADTSGTLPIADRLTIGSRVNSTFWANGTIRRLTYWPQRLSNSTLQTLTQP